jgi:hypothetical protein
MPVMVKCFTFARVAASARVSVALSTMEHAEQPAEREVAPAPAPKAAPEQALPAAPGFSAGSGFLGGLEGAPPLMRASVIGRLQRAAGNRAVSRALLARNGGEGGAPPSNAPHGGQHGSGPTLDVGTLEDHEKIDALPASIAAGEAVTVSGLWTTHSGWPGIAYEHEQLFLASIEVAPDLLDSFEDEREAFKASVEGRARNHLSENKQYVMEEQAKLGIPVDASFDSAGTPEDQAKRLGEVKALAAEAQRALRAKQDLLGIRVGVNGSAVDQGASGAPSAYEVVTFNPDRKPQQPSSEQGFKTWDEVNGHWTELEAAIAHMESTSPALFALLNAEGLDDDAAKADEAGALAADDDEVALSKLETAMRVLEGKLDEVFDEIGSSYEWDDLGLLFPQVLAGERWSKPIDNAIARKLIKDDADAEAAIDTALTTVGLIAALVGVFATGGMALALTAVGAAAGGTQAVISVDDYVKKQALREARTGKKEHDLVSKEAVDAARVKAILDVVFAFLDAADLGKAIKVAGAADDVAAKAARLGELPGAEKENAFKNALDVLGPPRALDTVGGLDAAKAQLGSGSAAAKRAQAYSDGLVAEMGEALGGKRAREEAAQRIGPDAVPRPPAPAGGGPPPGAAPSLKLPEDLLKDAQAFAAARTGLPAERALKVVAPAADSVDEITQVMKRAYDSAQAVSDEFTALATKEARAAKIHEGAVAWGTQRKIPPPSPGFTEGRGAFFDAQKWQIVYGTEELAAKEATNAAWEFMRSTGVHEMRHAQQYMDMARLALGKGTSEADIVAKMGIHSDAVAAAKQLGPIKPGDPGFGNAEKWFESFYGAGAKNRRAVLGELAMHRKQLMETDKALKKVQELKDKLAAAPPGDPGRAAVEKELRVAQANANARSAQAEKLAARRKANYDAYRDLPEEKDAWEVQAEYDAMLKSRRAAEDAAEAADMERKTGEFTPYRDPDEPIELDDADLEVVP